MEMEEIMRNIETESNNNIDIAPPMRETDGDREIEIDVAAGVDRIIDRMVEQDDLNENPKKISNNIIETMKDPINLDVANL